MKENEDPILATAEGEVASVTESSLRLQLTDLLLDRSRDETMGRSNRERSDIVQQIEAALDAYRSYFYPPEHR